MGVAGLQALAELRSDHSTTLEVKVTPPQVYEPDVNPATKGPTPKFTNPALMPEFHPYPPHKVQGLEQAMMSIKNAKNAHMAALYEVAWLAPIAIFG